MEEKIINKAVKPAISIVLATKGNKSKLLEKCIRSLQKQTFKKFEIVLVYSSFPNKLKDLFKTLDVRALKENSTTLSAARNLGVKNAIGDLIVFTDDDCEAPENWLEIIYSTFQQYPSLACLGGPNLTPIKECKSSPLKFIEGSFKESWRQRIYLDRSAVAKIGGCNVAYRKEVFDKIGYLDTTLRTAEDWEFHIRLAENGYHMRFDPKIFVWHHRQGLKHVFWGSSKAVPFYLSWKTLKYSKYEPIFASFYLTNVLCLLLLVALFISPFVFFLLFSLSLLGYLTLTAVRTKTYNLKIIYYPLIIPITLIKLIGFYYGLFKYMLVGIYHSFVALSRAN